MNITKAVVQLRGRLIETINEAGLPPVIVGFVLDGIQHEIAKFTAEDLKKEGTGNAERAERAEKPTE